MTPNNVSVAETIMTHMREVRQRWGVFILDLKLQRQYESNLLYSAPILNIECGTIQPNHPNRRRHDFGPVGPDDMI